MIKCSVARLVAGESQEQNCSEPVVSAYERLVIEKASEDEFWQTDAFLCALHEKTWTNTLERQGYRKVRE